MLLSLEVRDFVIVEHVELDFSSGMTVLTGETGAGKSILVDALGLLLGGRADAGVVRSGGERADLSARFALPLQAADHAGGDPQPEDAAAGRLASDAAPDDEDLASDARAWLLTNAFPGEDDELLLRRSIDASGRSRCWINGRSATLQQLRSLGASLLDIHGQHAHQSLLRPAAQRALVDAYAGIAPQVVQLGTAWRNWQALEAQLKDLAAREGELAEERAALHREVEELGAVALSAEAWLDLQAEQGRLAHANRLLDAAQWGVDSLAEGEADVLSLLNGLVQRLGELEQIDPALRAPRDLIESAAISLSEAVHALRRYAHGVESDPARLAAVEDQMQHLLAVARRYRLAPEAMQDRLATLRDRLDSLEAGTSRQALGEAIERARRAYAALAETVSTKRRAAAEVLRVQVTATIRELAMGQGAFSVALHAVPGGSAAGNETVEFCLAAYQGQAPASLARIASGGELSRVSLAVQTALSRVARVPTLIFDEVDTGIGGGVAEIVGRLLHAVAQQCQVMCVTHLPQVAAWADHHLLVSKDGTPDGAPVSQIVKLAEGARVEEIARMLGGVRLTETSRQHARELLAVRAGDSPPAP